MNFDLFAPSLRGESRELLAPGAMLLRGFAAESALVLVAGISDILRFAPLRHMCTPGGLRMSVAMSNCGKWGWISERRGYRYERFDPLSGKPWPVMPETFFELAQNAAAEAGYPDFFPDACLINRYEPAARMSLHQDRDERDQRHPIVSVSLGLPAVFLFGGDVRSDKPARINLQHSDVVVWGGPARLHYHGVLQLADGEHPLTGRCRFNLTFRKAV